MTAAEKLISLSSINGCATAAEHFCSASNTGGDTTFITRNPLFGEVQKINLLKGIVQIQHILIGEVQKISTCKK